MIELPLPPVPSVEEQTALCSKMVDAYFDKKGMKLNRKEVATLAGWLTSMSVALVLNDPQEAAAPSVN